MKISNLVSKGSFISVWWHLSSSRVHTLSLLLSLQPLQFSNNSSRHQMYKWITLQGASNFTMASQSLHAPHNDPTYLASMGNWRYWRLQQSCRYAWFRMKAASISRVFWIPRRRPWPAKHHKEDTRFSNLEWNRPPIGMVISNDLPVRTEKHADSFSTSHIWYQQ